MLMKLINRRVEICRMLHKKSEGAARERKNKYDR